MPKNGSSRRKRRARRLAAEQNLPYTRALRHTSTREPASEPVGGRDPVPPAGSGPSALEALRTAAEQVRTAGPADPPAALAKIHDALALTAAANDLLHEAMLDLGQAYWPGKDFLDDARRGYLDLAVERLGAALAVPARPVGHRRSTVLTPAELEPSEYWPVQYEPGNGVVYEADEAEKQRQLLLFRSEAVAAANRSVWLAVEELLARIAGRVRDPGQRRTSRIAVLLVREIAHPAAGAGRRDVEQRVQAITVGRRAAGELVADHALMRRLHAAVAAEARPSGWAVLSRVSAALERADPSWSPAQWGYLSDLKLLAATKQFAIRTLPRDRQQVIEVRARRPDDRLHRADTGTPPGDSMA